MDNNWTSFAAVHWIFSESFLLGTSECRTLNGPAAFNLQGVDEAGASWTEIKSKRRKVWMPFGSSKMNSLVTFEVTAAFWTVTCIHHSSLWYDFCTICFAWGERKLRLIKLTGLWLSNYTTKWKWGKINIKDSLGWGKKRRREKVRWLNKNRDFAPSQKEQHSPGIAIGLEHCGGGQTISSHLIRPICWIKASTVSQTVSFTCLLEIISPDKSTSDSPDAELSIDSRPQIFVLHSSICVWLNFLPLLDLPRNSWLVLFLLLPSSLILTLHDLDWLEVYRSSCQWGPLRSLTIRHLDTICSNDQEVGLAHHIPVSDILISGFYIWPLWPCDCSFCERRDIHISCKQEDRTADQDLVSIDRR